MSNIHKLDSFTLDFAEVQKINIGKVNQYDDIILELPILFNNEPINLTDYSVLVKAGKEDGTFAQQDDLDGTITKNNNILTIDCERQVTTHTGKVNIDITLIDKNKEQRTAQIYLTVNPASVNDEFTPSENLITMAERLDNKTIEARDVKVRLDQTVDNANVIINKFGNDFDQYKNLAQVVTSGSELESKLTQRIQTGNNLITDLESKTATASTTDTNLTKTTTGATTVYNNLTKAIASGDVNKINNNIATNTSDINKNTLNIESNKNNISKNTTSINAINSLIGNQYLNDTITNLIFNNISRLNEMQNIGSNSNGTYVYFSNGFMVCYHSRYCDLAFSAIDDSNTLQNVFTCGTIMYNFPKQFVNDDIVVVPFIRSSSFATITMADIQKTYCIVRPFCNYGRLTDSYKVGYIAVGRWK